DVNVSNDMSELSRRLHERTRKGKLVIIAGLTTSKFWKVAAAVILIAGVAFVSVRLWRGRSVDQVAVTGKARATKEDRLFGDSSHVVTSTTTTDTAMLSPQHNNSQADTKLHKAGPLNKDGSSTSVVTDDVALTSGLFSKKTKADISSTISRD